MNDLPKRKQIRLKNYDYSQNGCYFVTICAYKKQNLFWKPDICTNDYVRLYYGNNEQSKIILSPIGEIVNQCWNNINDVYSNVKTDCYIIMPNHFHGIIVINDNDENEQHGPTGGQGRPPLQKIIQGFKSVTTRMCFKYGYRQIWQRNYYEHIIRNETDYLQTAEYITNNPLKLNLQNE